MSRDLPGDWRARRQAALQRDNNSCRNCGITGGMRGVDLHVHHLVPRESGGSHDLRNLVTLCQKCHYRVHYGDETAPDDHVSYFDQLLESIESFRWRKANITGIDPRSIARKVAGSIPTPDSIQRHVSVRSVAPDVNPRGFSDFLVDVRTHSSEGLDACPTD